MNSRNEVPEIRPILVANAEASELRDKANFTYSTIAIVSALLAAITFSAYITPPASPIYIDTSTVPPGDGAVTEAKFRNVILGTFYNIRTVVVPVTFILNLLSTLSASVIIIYVNSSRTSEAEMVKMFGDPENEHEVIQVPATLLFVGVFGTLLAIFMGFPLRYPQLSGFWALLVMSSLVGLLLLTLVYTATCGKTGDSPVWNAIAECCCISHPLRHILGRSTSLFFSKAKREDAAPEGPKPINHDIHRLVQDHQRVYNQYYGATEPAGGDATGLPARPSGCAPGGQPGCAPGGCSLM